MITEAAFVRRLQLAECWEVLTAEYEPEPWLGRFTILIRETAARWPRAAGTRSWAMTMWRRELPMKRAGKLLGEHDTRLWRMLLAHVALARRRLDRSDLVSLGVDEMSSRQGHHYLTVFADLGARRVVFATDGKDHATFALFYEDLLAHNGHPRALTQAAIDLSAADQKGLRENLGNAQGVFDPFHVCAWVGVAVDEVRRWEARAGTPAAREALKGSRYLFRKNP